MKARRPLAGMGLFAGTAPSQRVRGMALAFLLSPLCLLSPLFLLSLSLTFLMSLPACTTLPQVVQLEEGDGDHAVTLKTGQLLEIRLIHPGRGTALALGSVVAPVLDRVGKPTLHDDTVRAGVSGTGNYESWIFRAAQPGSVDVRMDYRMQWETTGAPSRSVTYHVTVQ